MDGLYFSLSNTKNEENGQKDNAQGRRYGMLHEKFRQARYAADVHGEMGREGQLYLLDHCVLTLLNC